MSALPYHVEFGPSCSQKVEFADFGHALAFYRGYNAARDEGYSEPPRIVNYDRAELGNSGLTEDEKEQMSNVE